MDTENITVEQIKLTASTGKALYNGTTYARIVYLAKEEDKSKWQEVDEPKDESTTDIILDTTTLEGSKAQKIAEITAYDSSSSINSFSIKEEQYWLDKETRAGLMLRFAAEKSSGKTETTLWAGSVCIPLSLDDAFKMLYTLEMYASTCYDVTAKHKANVLDLDSINEVLAYDYKDGYPDHLIF